MNFLRTALIFASLLGSQLFAQNLTPRGAAPAGFETLRNWNWSYQVDADQINRTWTPTGVGSEEKLGREMLRLVSNTNGGAGFGQLIFDIQPSTKYQVLAIQAYRESLVDFSAGEWAGFGITYYDANWNEVFKYEKEIQGAKFNGPWRGDGDGISPHSIGCVVPQNARHALMWIWMTGSNNRVYADEFGLFDYQTNAITNLIAAGSDLYEANGNPTTLVGNEFWLPASPEDQAGINAEQYLVSLRGSTSTLKTIALGQPTRSTVAYQNLLRLEPGKTYQYTYSVDRNVPLSFMGVDFFDANQNRISGVTREITIGDANPFTGAPRFNFTVPANAARTTAWFWVESTPNPLNVNLLLIFEQ